jgi:acetate kinase
VGGKSVLIVNMGSSSLKWVVLDATSEEVKQQGEAHWQGSRGGQHADELAAALGQATAVDAVGHRVVHGGLKFSDAVVIDDGVRAEIEELSELAPLHNPAALAGIDAARRQFPGVPQVAAFDTAFHRGMPEAATVYPIPWDWTTTWQLRRFGFHGLSVAYAVERAQATLGSLPSRLVVCHLGAGCSATAVLDGRSVNTSMGFTPLDGVMMTQRSGAVDPGMLVHLLTQRGVSAAELDRRLNEESGLLGVSGVSADLRLVVSAAAAGEARARLALDIFIHRLVECIGGMAATLGGLDALVFTGGIGEHSFEVRERVTAALAFLSPFHVLVVTAREDLTILHQLKRLLKEF